MLAFPSQERAARVCVTGTCFPPPPPGDSWWAPQGPNQALVLLEGEGGRGGLKACRGEKEGEMVTIGRVSDGSFLHRVKMLLLGGAILSLQGCPIITIKGGGLIE